MIIAVPYVRALTEGGMVWEGEETYASLAEALQERDTAVGAWMKENGFDEGTTQQSEHLETVNGQSGWGNEEEDESPIFSNHPLA